MKILVQFIPYSLYLKASTAGEMYNMFVVFIYYYFYYKKNNKLLIKFYLQQNQCCFKKKTTAVGVTSLFIL